MVYKHKKTGKLCELLTDNFMFIKNGEWRKCLILYKTLYNNSDGKYFSRTVEYWNNKSQKLVKQFKDYDLEQEYTWEVTIKDK